jgi:hypothetical protein
VWFDPPFPHRVLLRAGPSGLSLLKKAIFVCGAVAIVFGSHPRQEECARGLRKLLPIGTPSFNPLVRYSRSLASTILEESCQ